MSKVKKIVLASIFIIVVFIAWLIWISSVSHFPHVQREQSDFANIKTAIKMYKLDNGSLPESLDDLIEGGPRQYLSEMPVDSWGNRYKYFIDKEDAEGSILIMSFGADGLYGGIEENRDLLSIE